MEHRLDDEQFEEICKQLESLARGVRRIASGDQAPDGLEGVAIAIGGEGIKNSLAEAMATGLSEIASEIGGGLADIASAIREKGVA